MRTTKNSRLPRDESGSIALTHNHVLFLFLDDISPLCGTSDSPVLAGDAFSGFQSHSGQPDLHFPEAYLLHVPGDSPLVSRLLTTWQPALASKLFLPTYL